ncbi:MAG: GAF domain-containing protein [Leptolyngbyaceae cyanobacterium SM2_3_12]|nr:GAF domain-containing protein [Leptolyngbyaceae cyanobacterium SM2_3_12]
MEALRSVQETARVTKLYDYKILDTAPETAYDAIVFLATHICNAPIAVISLLDTHRQWFKAKIGLDVCETSRDVSFCAHAILQPEILVVPDALEDPRFCDNPLVTGEPRIRFYAGSPLITPDGYTLGTLCIIDHHPRVLTEAQIEALKALSRQVVAQLELKLSLQELRREMGERRQLEASQQGLINLNRELESLVQQRTFDLQTSKTDLEIRVQERTLELTASLHRLQEVQAELIQREAMLRHDALHDRLTGLPNRTQFLHRLEQTIQRSQKKQVINTPFYSLI